MSASVAAVRVDQRKVVLRGVSPLVWRRTLVRSDTTLAQLHRVLQLVMGWEDGHLQHFRIHGRDHGSSALGRSTYHDNPNAHTLADFRLRPRERFAYVHDRGAWWQHDIRLEQVLPLDPTGAYPVCTGGRQACPPEECRGPGGYRALLRERVSLAAVDDLGLIAEAVRRFLEDGDRGTPDEREHLAAALARAKERDRLDPDRFDRRAVDRAWQRLAHMAAD